MPLHEIILDRYVNRNLFIYKSPIGDIYCIFEGRELIGLSIKANTKQEATGNGNKITKTFYLSPIASDTPEGGPQKVFDFLGYRYRRLSLPKKSLTFWGPCSGDPSRLFSEFDAYFGGHLKEFKQEIKFVCGTEFEHKVWTALKKIPYGETRSYKWIAEMAGSPKAARAVGQALKRNPLPIILPCHRVIASNGSIGGFSCGVSVKEWMLKHEGNHC